MTDKIFEIIGGKPKKVRDIKISETMRKDSNTYRETEGLWEGSTGTIIIKRSTLSTLENYCGTLIHEAGHCLSNSQDISREFEQELTRLIGVVVARLIKEI